MVVIRTDFGTDDPEIAKMLVMMAGLPEHSELRLEMEAMLHSQLARVAWQAAALARQRREAHEARQRRHNERKAAKQTTESLVIDEIITENGRSSA